MWWLKQQQQRQQRIQLNCRNVTLSHTHTQAHILSWPRKVCYTLCQSISGRSLSQIAVGAKLGGASSCECKKCKSHAWPKAQLPKIRACNCLLCVAMTARHIGGRGTNAHTARCCCGCCCLFSSLVLPPVTAAAGASGGMQRVRICLL